MELSNTIYRVTSIETADVTHLLLVGPPGSGKSFAAASFPDPIFAMFDNNMPPEKKKLGLKELPFYDTEWVNQCVIKEGAMSNSFKDRPVSLFGRYLRTLARELKPNQTLVIDHLQRISDRLFEAINADYASAIKSNAYEEWTLFGNFMCGVFTICESLKCNVVMLSQEEELRELESSKILTRRWLMPGKMFAPRVPSFFNNVFRQTKITESPNKISSAIAQPFNPNEKADDKYYWQIRKDELFDTIRTTIPGNQKYVPANYSSFNIK